jgi:hypothetical protein
MTTAADEDDFGEVLLPKRSEHVAAAVTCPGCRHTLPAAATFCPWCNAAPGRAPVPVATPSKHRRYVDLVAELDSIGAKRDWFAEGALEGTPLVVLAGAEKKGKSYAIAQLAVATITGGMWLGAFPIRRPGTFVVLDAEYGPHEYTRRVARIARAEGHDPREVLAGLRYYYGGFGLEADRNSDFGQIFEDIKRDKPAAMAVDPLRNYLGEGDENSAKDVLTAMRLLSAARDWGECPVVAAHHLNRAGTMSGSRALKTRADLFIEGTDDDEPSYNTIGRTIRRADRIRQPFIIDITHEDDDDDTIAKTFVRARFAGEQTERGTLTRSALRVLDALKKHVGGASKSTLRKALGNANAGLVGGALEELRNAGLAEKKGELWSVSTKHFFDSLHEGQKSERNGAAR